MNLLPKPPAWMGDAVCAQTDPEVFFPEKAERVKASDAKAVCSRCPVKNACLEWAINNGERHGVWGGTTERQRRKLRRIGNERLALATAEAGGAA